MAAALVSAEDEDKGEVRMRCQLSSVEGEGRAKTSRSSLLSSVKGG